MSNWTAITEADISAGKVTDYLVNMRAQATEQGVADPLPSMITNVTSMLRGLISSDNSMDVDQTTLPNSLRDLAVRIVVRRIKIWLDVDLTNGELKQADEDRTYLVSLRENKVNIEKPDNSGGDAEMQSTGGFDIVSGTNRHNWTRRGMDGL